MANSELDPTIGNAPVGPDAYFRSAIATGKIFVQFSRETGQYVFYPRLFPPGDASATLDWVECAGTATVYATTILRRRPADGGDINIAIVQLEEGPRLISRVVDVLPEKVTIGLKVQIGIAKLGGKDAIVFSMGARDENA